jgi:DNA sulfur modification protein DndC
MIRKNMDVKIDLQNEAFDQIIKDIQNIYLEYQLPWVIGYSGGKDSTALLQMIWYALEELPREQLTNPIHVLSSDTLVETPVIVGHIISNIDKINESAKIKKLPIEAHIVRPKISETFWVNLIGKGYPAPSTQFRWCTDRLKIKPANHFIETKLKEFGNVIVVLGARKEESITRKQVLELKSRQIPDSKLTHHSTMPSAYCYTPIEDLTTKDIWDYLLSIPSPWGAHNGVLFEIYKNSADGECPLVVDEYTSSCGNSRFGCWVCTVVQADHSMEALVAKGEAWLKPLLDFRDYMAMTQDKEKKAKYRNPKRRNGKIIEKAIKDKKGVRQKTGEVILGPYWMWFRKELLKKLLSIEDEIQKTTDQVDFTLITQDELMEIRRLWRMEEVEDPDWEDAVPKIYQEVKGIELEYQKDAVGEFSLIEHELLSKICVEEGIPVQLIKKLLVAEQKAQGVSVRSNIFKNLRSVFNEEWRTEKEVLKSFK